MLDAFNGRMTPDECWDLLMYAPRDSPVMSAIADDPEFASSAKPSPPKLAQFSPEVEALAAVHDLLASLLSTVTALGGGEPPKVAPYPRPVTVSQLAQKRAEREAARRQHADIVFRMTGERI